jgi:hypothetical protein
VQRKDAPAWRLGDRLVAFGWPLSRSAAMRPLHAFLIFASTVCAPGAGYCDEVRGAPHETAQIIEPQSVRECVCIPPPAAALRGGINDHDYDAEPESRSQDGPLPQWTQETEQVRADGSAFKN